MDELQVLNVSWNKIVSSGELKALNRFVTEKKKLEWTNL
jgi:hypothetical protein